MSKALVLSAAVALAVSGAAFAKGGSQHPRTGATADQYIDSSVQITANDCATLSVDSARNACMSSVQASAGGGASVGATSGAGAGSASGSTHGGASVSMDRNMPAGSNESKPGSSSSRGNQHGR